MEKTYVYLVTKRYCNKTNKKRGYDVVKIFKNVSDAIAFAKSYIPKPFDQIAFDVGEITTKYINPHVVAEAVANNDTEKLKWLSAYTKIIHMTDKSEAVNTGIYSVYYNTEISVEIMELH